MNIEDNSNSTAFSECVSDAVPGNFSRERTGDGKMESVQSSTLKDYVTTITILESISNAIFILNKEGKIEYANKSALRLLRIELFELVGKYIDEILIDNDQVIKDEQPASDQSYDQNVGLIEKLNQGEFDDIEAYLINNGFFVPVFLDFGIVKDSAENVRYIIVTAKDISRRKSMEKELRQQQTLSISRERLRALGELSVGLVHELSQPLATLRLKVELMNSRAKNGKVQKLTTERNCKDMLRLIDRMSDTIQNMRRFAHQTEDTTIAMVNVNEVVDNASNLVTYELKKRNIKLRIDEEKTMPYIIANPLLIEQVLVNLLTNARDAFDERECSSDHADTREKWINICTRANNDKWVEILVEDNAGGIDASIRNKIFDPFFTTKEPEENSGLGLSISKNIITSLGGDITVGGKENVGTKIRIRIPLGHTEERMQLFNLIEMLYEN